MALSPHLATGTGFANCARALLRVLCKSTTVCCSIAQGNAQQMQDKLRNAPSAGYSTPLHCSYQVAHPFSLAQAAGDEDMAEAAAADEGTAAAGEGAAAAAAAGAPPGSFAAESAPAMPSGMAAMLRLLRGSYENPAAQAAGQEAAAGFPPAQLQQVRLFVNAVVPDRAGLRVSLGA